MLSAFAEVRAPGGEEGPGRALDPPAHDRVIESTFTTVRHRTKVTKGPGSKAAGITMAFKLIETAEERRVMIFIRSQEDGTIHSVRLPRTTSRSS